MQLATLPVPILVELRAYARTSSTGNDFVDFVCEGSTCPYPLARSHLETLLQEGQAFMMLDGLDEVFDPDRRSQVVTEILEFADHYPRSPLLITSRVIGYKGDQLRKAGFRHFVLQDFTDEQIQQFIDRWHEFAYPPGTERERKRDRLKAALANLSAIRQLAGNPLLLTMMAILNRNQELPRDRAELYTQSSQVLLQQWELEKTLDEADALTIDYKDKQAMLRRVDFHMQATETGLAGNLIRQDELHRSSPVI
jgi:predicted NACHT family NTPase